MTADTNLERRVAQHYASEPPLRAPDRVLLSALATIDTTRQRRGIFAPWRSDTMPIYAKLAAAAAVVAVLAVGIWQFAAPAGFGGPNATPTTGPSPSAPSAPSSKPSSAVPTAPPLTGVHTSTLYGLTVSYPDGWTVEPGTKPWTVHALPGFGSPFETEDIIHSSQAPDQLFISVSAHQLDRGESGPEWADLLNAEPDPGSCPGFDPVVVAGLDGRLYSCNEPLRALFWTDDTGYVVWIYRSDNVANAERVYDLTWFQSLLATVEVAAAGN